MGSSSSKIGLCPEPPKKDTYFSFMKLSRRKTKDFEDKINQNKHQTHTRSKQMAERSKEIGNRHINRHEEMFRTRFDPRVTARYDIKALIGQGSFSHVVRVEHRHTHQPFAIKLLEIRGNQTRDSSHAELGVLRRVRHANIIHLVEVFETPHRIYLVLELATGGELLDRIVSQGSFTERDATKALIMVSSGLRYIHALGVIHRDLKPENLLYYHSGQDSRLIITDFGLACWGRKSHVEESGDVLIEDSCEAGSDLEIVGSAESEKVDITFGDTDGAKSSNIIDRKSKFTPDNWRLEDDGKVREKSGQGRIVAIRRDGRRDMNKYLISSEDERKKDQSFRFDRMGGGSGGVEEEGIYGPEFSRGTKRPQNYWLERCQADGLEAYKHNISMDKKRVERFHQERQRQVLHDKVNSRRQTREDDKCKALNSKTSKSSTENSKPQKPRDWALKTLCGTPEYLSPEMVASRMYGCEVDMWALGVISYILLSGSMPFEQRSRPRLFTSILRGSYSFHGQPWSSISNLAKDFIENLLCVNPEQRMTAEQALKHPWLLTMASSSSNKNLHRPISRNLRQRASRASNRSSSSHSVHGSRSSHTHILNLTH